MKIVLNRGNVKICVKTNFLKDGYPVFGQRTVDDVEQCFSEAMGTFLKNYGYGVTDAQFAKGIYETFKKEYKIPLVYCSVNNVMYEGEKVTEL